MRSRISLILAAIVLTSSASYLRAAAFPFGQLPPVRPKVAAAFPFGQLPPVRPSVAATFPFGQLPPVRPKVTA